jgi:acyl CoA:acetate/3-ketoacid CoA transferase beta subunit
VKKCSLPLTGQRCINMVITDLAVFVMDDKAGRFKLIELAPGVTVDEVKKKTEAEFIVAEKVGVVSV